MGSDPEKLITKADKLTKLSFTRWSTDWKSATGLYEQAANGFRLAKSYEKAKEAFEKASKGQEMLSSPWDAAKHMESAATMAKELGNWKEVADFYRRASELYNECGRPQPASDALGKGARALEDGAPDVAVQLYTEACAILEEDGKEQMAFDLFRDAARVYLKLEKYEDAATTLIGLASAADKCNATHSQCKSILQATEEKAVPGGCDYGFSSLEPIAYLSAIIVYLYAHDFKQAEKCYNDCCQVEVFLNSDQGRCAGKFLSAYAEGDVEDIKRVSQSSTVSNLDHTIIKIARKLPTGDVSSLKNEAMKDNEEPLDEDDLT